MSGVAGRPADGQSRFLWATLGIAIIGVVAVFGWTALVRPERQAPGLVVLERQTHASPQSPLSPAAPVAELPVHGVVPNFSLLDQEGRPFDRGRLMGQIWVADFIFTRCAGQCLAMAERMKVLQERLPAESGVRFVSFSVDPEYDTPEVLSRYAQEHRAQPDRWFLLTGERSAIYRLSTDGFRLGVADTGGTEAEPILHSTRLVLVDGAGRIRGYYDGTEPSSVEQVLADIERLKRSGT